MNRLWWGRLKWGLARYLSPLSVSCKFVCWKRKRKRLTRNSFFFVGDLVKSQYSKLFNTGNIGNAGNAETRTSSTFGTTNSGNSSKFQTLKPQQHTRTFHSSHGERFIRPAIIPVLNFSSYSGTSFSGTSDKYSYNNSSTSTQKRTISRYTNNLTAPGFVLIHGPCTCLRKTLRLVMK